MLVLIAYDVSTVESAGRRRLRKVAQACKDYGTRAQKSVFECHVGDKEWAILKDRLLSVMKPEEVCGALRLLIARGAGPGRGLKLMELQEK